MSTDALTTWPAKERPREKLIESGPQSLSDSELLAVLLRSGMRGRDVLSLSRELIRGFGGLRGLFAAEPRELLKIKGLGAAKSGTILAVRELAKRFLKEEIVGKTFIRDPRTVVDFLYHSLRDEKREVFKVLFLDKGNRILHEEDLFRGTVDEAAIHPREVVKAALARHAVGLIFVHNHPSGRVQPSPEDREMTRKLVAACQSVSIRVLDHIIVGDNHYFSFNEHNLL